jgi:hypothetical protein
MLVGQAIRSLKMKLTKQVILLVSLTATVAACTASVRVMPGPQDTNWVVARDVEKHWAEKAAHRAAVEYCEDRGLEAVFISDRVWYEGMMDEREREAIRRQSEAATVVGGIMRGSDHVDWSLKAPVRPDQPSPLAETMRRKFSSPADRLPEEV